MSVTELTKIAPLGPAIAAAAEQMTLSSDTTSFWRYVETQDLLCPGIAVDRLQAVLYEDELARTAAGRAFTNAAETVLRRTNADGYRPFDKVYVNGRNAVRAAGEFSDLVGELAHRSKLLADVCDALAAQHLIRKHLTFAAYAGARARVTDTGLVIGEDGDLISWADVELLAPGTQAAVTDLIAQMDTGLPEVLPDDGGAARCP